MYGATRLLYRILTRRRGLECATPAPRSILLESDLHIALNRLGPGPIPLQLPKDPSNTRAFFEV